MRNCHQCRICGSRENNKEYVAREMMFGFRDSFVYFECSRCGCLQISEIPANIEKYYPEDYIAFSIPKIKKAHLWKRFLKRQRLAFVLGKDNVFGRLLPERYGTPGLLEWVKIADVDFEAPILEIGSGNGRMLFEMYKYGFSDLTGIDPFIADDFYFSKNIKILKKDLHQVERVYGFVMLHHSFEHIPNPLETLEHISRVLAPNRYVLIRVPVAGCYAWRKYGVNWVQLDAPRHFFLHTEKSIRLLANAAGFELVETIYDSTAFQFWASEQYTRDIPLRHENSYGVNREKSIFSRDDIERFKAEAEALNQSGDGDQVCFFLKRNARC